MDVPWPIFTTFSTDFTTAPALSPAQQERRRDANIVKMMMPTLEYAQETSGRAKRLKRVLRRTTKEDRRAEAGEGRRASSGAPIEATHGFANSPPPSYDEIFGTSAAPFSIPSSVPFSPLPFHPVSPATPEALVYDIHLVSCNRAPLPAAFLSGPLPSCRRLTCPSVLNSTSVSSTPATATPRHVRRPSIDSGYASLGSPVTSRTGEEDEERVRASNLIGDTIEDGTVETTTGRGIEGRWKKLGRG
ncbi:hypothetical protein JCM11251_003163 [Rhodosporidiobolus azoricus]